MASMSSTYTGRVASVNPKGLKLEGHESWCNVSKFAPNVVLPERGETVTICVDAQGFIRSIERGDGPAPIRGGSDAPGATSGHHERDRTITRLAVLKAAAEFGAARPNLKSGEVLAIAASWERWVYREQETTAELMDAF